jgi:flagellar basal-body rod protein FlgF
MSGLVESATAILSASERRLEVAAHNVANITTPGFKRQVGFSQLLAPASSGAEAAARSMLTELAVRRDFTQGKLTPTSNPLDIAISGTGFFQLRAGEAIVYSRQGQFRLAEDGTVVTPQGYALQQAGGGDLVLESGAVTILEDGTVTENGAPVGRIAIYAADDADALRPVGESFFAADAGGMEVSADALLRQGMTENSNVALGDEMVATMAALRQSEAGARLVQVYDELIGRALTTLGGQGR